MSAKRVNLAVVMLAAGLGGCATMSGDECATSDWHAIGYEDGSNGYSADRLGSHRKACAKHGVTPNFQAYQRGRDEGLNNFCQPSRGFNLGANGGSYNGVCSAHREFDFIEAYNAGHRLHQLRSRVNSANSTIYYKEQEIDRNKDRMKNREAALIAADTAPEDRVLILVELKELAEENGILEAEIRDLIEDRAVHEQELAAYEAMIADVGY